MPSPVHDAARLWRAAAAHDGATHPVDAMARAMRRPVRAVPDATRRTAAKYAACCAVAAACGALAAAATHAAFALTAADVVAGIAAFVVGFYLFEVQLVFLLPLALDAHAADATWPAAFALTRKVGTVRAFATVVPIAALMALGLFTTSPRRRWCRGCAAVALWYEEIAP